MAKQPIINVFEDPAAARKVARDIANTQLPQDVAKRASGQGSTTGSNLKTSSVPAPAPANKSSTPQWSTGDSAALLAAYPAKSYSNAPAPKLSSQSTGYIGTTENPSVFSGPGTVYEIPDGTVIVETSKDVYVTNIEQITEQKYITNGVTGGFNNWEVDGLQGLVSTGNDTVNFVSGPNVTITANNNATPKTLTISAYGNAGSSGFSGYSGAGQSGFSGYSGVGGPGESGYSGYSGAIGLSGYSGATGQGTELNTSIVYLNTPSTTTATGWQKVPIDTVYSDDASYWNASGKYFLPTKPGWYLFIGRARTTTAGLVTAGLGLNGTQVIALGNDVTAGQIAVGGSTLIYLNGTSDYVDLRVFSNGIYTYGPLGIFDVYMEISGPLQGISGYSGYSGIGTSGYSGTSGVSGFSGPAGGPSGYSGYSGQIGQQGTSGYSGTSTIGNQTIWIPAAAMTTRTTAGASLNQVETATNKIMLSTMNFADGASILYAQFNVRMPKSWNEGTVTASFTWTANSTSTNSVVWGLQGVALSNDETIDTAFGTAGEVTDANTSTAYQVHISNATSPITIGNTPSEQDWVVFQVYRDPTNVNDTLAATALLLGVTLIYTTDATTDN